MEGFEQKLSTLSRGKILQYKNEGRIIISPFEPRCVNTSSVDVRLGPHYYREQIVEGKSIYSPWDEKDVRTVWGKPKIARVAGPYFKELKMDIPGGVRPTDQVILIRSGETILAHTIEFIGGRDGITTMMKARSSAGRNFIEVCKCAGWGDDGYTNRWTMEITNNSRYYTIPLVVGRRLAQIIFFEIGGPEVGNYSDDGKYQTTRDQLALESSWIEDSMIPKMWLDWELRE